MADQEYDGLLNNEQSTQEQSEESKVRLKDGSEVTLSDIEAWKKGNMLQADYTRKMQELAEQRRSDDAMRSEYQQLKGYIGEIQKKDPYFLAQAQRILAGQQPQNPYADDPVLGPIASRLQNVEQAVNAWGKHTETIGEKQEAMLLQQEIAYLQQKYPKMHLDTVLNAIYTNPDVDTEQVAKASHEAMAARLNSELQAMASQNQKLKSALSEGSGGRTAGIIKPQKPPTTLAEVERNAQERLRLSQQLP